jgi:hypothetical protein
MRTVKVVSELKATNWILERWAASVGDGLYDAPWEDVPRFRVPPLSDQMAIVVDQLVLRSGDKTKRLISLWYRTALPKTVIAKRVGVSRDVLYVDWNAALWYFRGRFLDSPLSDLRLVARTDLPDITPEKSDEGVAESYNSGSNETLNMESCPLRKLTA